RERPIFQVICGTFQYYESVLGHVPKHVGISTERMFFGKLIGIEIIQLRPQTDIKVQLSISACRNIPCKGSILIEPKEENTLLSTGRILHLQGNNIPLVIFQ